MRLLADVHISPKTVHFLNEWGHNVIAVPEVLSPDADDDEIVATAIGLRRAILSYDLDFAEIIIHSGLPEPSLVSLRLREEEIDLVNRVLRDALKVLEDFEGTGFIASVRPHGYRVQRL